METNLLSVTYTRREQPKLVIRAVSPSWVNHAAARRWLVKATVGLMMVTQTFFAIAAGEPPANLTDPDLIASGKKRFNQACFYCHGDEGSGGKYSPLQNRPDLEPRFIFDTISNGRIRGSSVMPPWGKSLTQEQIWQLVAYIVSLRDYNEQHKQR